MVGFLKKRRMKITLAVFFVAYFFIYLVLSLRGRYEPGAIGLNGVKWYEWVPRGFVTDFRWSVPINVVFYPLYFLDQKYWHSRDKAGNGSYPINEVPVEDIGIIHEARS